jgi:hypothetical protein
VVDVLNINQNGVTIFLDENHERQSGEVNCSANRAVDQA